jgi:hypothetical protein
VGGTRGASGKPSGFQVLIAATSSAGGRTRAPVGDRARALACGARADVPRLTWRERYRRHAPR